MTILIYIDHLLMRFGFLVKRARVVCNACRLCLTVGLKAAQCPLLSITTRLKIRISLIRPNTLAIRPILLAKRLIKPVGGFTLYWFWGLVCLESDPIITWLLPV